MERLTSDLQVKEETWCPSIAKKSPSISTRSKYIKAFNIFTYYFLFPSFRGGAAHSSITPTLHNISISLMEFSPPPPTRAHRTFHHTSIIFQAIPSIYFPVCFSGIIFLLCCGILSGCLGNFIWIWVNFPYDSFGKRLQFHAWEEWSVRLMETNGGRRRWRDAGKKQEKTKQKVKIRYTNRWVYKERWIDKWIGW